MAAEGTLYTYPDNFRAHKALVAAQYSGAKVTISAAFKLGETNKSAAFLKKFPLGKVPAFEAKNGTCIFESNAIAHYLSNDVLTGGSDKLKSALIQQWISFADQEILPAACTWVFPTLGIIQYNKVATEQAMENLKKYMAVLNETLKTKTFLVGERVTLADISLACNLLMLYQQVLEPSWRQPYQNVNRWFTTLINQPQFKAVLGEVHLCEKMAQFDSKKFAELHPKKGKDEGKAKSPKQKEQKPKQKQEKKKPAPEKDEDMDATETAMASEPKQTDPYAALPKSSFNMDEFKRTYCNEDTDAVALPYLYEKFDKEGYSFWLGEYQYPEDLSLIFMTCNLVSGMFQRLEKLKKTAFASVCIWGENKKNTISGLWIMRGQELAFKMCADWQTDYESYSWKKIEDPFSPENKKMVEQYLRWEGEFKGMPFNQGKLFK